MTGVSRALSIVVVALLAGESRGPAAAPGGPGGDAAGAQEAPPAGGVPDVPTVGAFPSCFCSW